jgi:uncharacterized coiled-coil protein SlyX
MIANALHTAALQASDLSGIWGAVIVAGIIAVVALAFAAYNAQRGILPGKQADMLRTQEHTIAEMETRIARQTGLIDSLNEQAARLWERIRAQDAEAVILRAENTDLKRKFAQQEAVIAGLSFQLQGWAADSLSTGKKLRGVLTDRLGEDDLRKWAFDMGIPYESLKGASQSALVIAMLETLERVGRLGEGLEVLRDIRPDLPLSRP